ncbi:HNH endonuclease [Pantoea sp. Eser]|nr:HNH endonuclease [Pantoea sp. Eser]
MRFNYDLLPGERLTFEEIALRYAQQYPEEKELTARALLSPSISFRTLKIRAVFAQEESNSPLEDLLFIANDNERKNYLRRFEHYLKQNLSFLYFRRSEKDKRDNLINSRGYKLVLMYQDEEEAYWQLFNPQANPCFPQSRRIQFIVVLSTPQHKVPAAVMPGTEVGRRVKARVLQRAGQAEFSAGVKARYGACVMTGTRLTDRHNWPWVEACHIDTQENDEWGLADNSIDNGLFLRSDLQRLFLNRLISIDGGSGQIQVHPSDEAQANISPYYQELNGRICSLWPAVPPATRQRLRARR